MRGHHLLPLTLLLIGADTPWADARAQDLHGFVRAVSLDLRGVVPSAEELTAIEEAGELDVVTLDAWLNSPEFTESVVEAHRARFLNNLDLRLLNDRRFNNEDDIFFQRGRSEELRGAAGTHCGDFEAEVDAQNRPLSWQDNGDGSISEGWVWVTPYWAPEEPLQVCALDAQSALVSDSGVDCSTVDAIEDPGCGCGPELMWCFVNEEENRLEDAISADLDERVREMLRTGAPYSSLFRGGSMYVNGASAHFWKYIAPFGVDNYSVPVPPEDIPELDYDDEAFVAVPLPDHHAGVLTSAGWLLRHQTNRGRANRFYGGFLCAEFLPVASGAELLSNGELPTPDLQTRSGCLDCHARLEPWSALWGRWSQAGARYMSEADFPAYSEECASCLYSGTGCDSACAQHYIVEPAHDDEINFVGTFRPYAFLWGEDGQRPDEGPAAWVDEALADGSLAACAVTKVSERLLGAAPPQEDAEAWAAAFSEDEDFRALTRRVVTSGSYWGGAE